MAEGGHFVYHPVNFSIRQATHIVQEVLSTLARSKNIELREDVHPDLRVYADINMVTSVIQNLVSNALKFTSADGSGKVLISASRATDGVEVCIHDTGLGMTAEQIETVFEPELNVSLKGTSGEMGTGLGLVLCKQFMDINQGQISVSSEKGKGTTFRVVLPAAGQSHTALS